MLNKRKCDHSSKEPLTPKSPQDKKKKQKIFMNTLIRELEKRFELTHKGDGDLEQPNKQTQICSVDSFSSISPSCSTEYKEPLMHRSSVLLADCNKNNKVDFGVLNLVYFVNEAHKTTSEKQSQIKLLI